MDFVQRPHVIRHANFTAPKPSLIIYRSARCPLRKGHQCRGRLFRKGRIDIQCHNSTSLITWTSAMTRIIKTSNQFVVRNPSVFLAVTFYFRSIASMPIGRIRDLLVDNAEEFGAPAKFPDPREDLAPSFAKANVVVVIVSSVFECGPNHVVLEVNT